MQVGKKSKKMVRRIQKASKPKPNEIVDLYYRHVFIL